MNKIFKFSKCNVFYKRCMLASIAHAIMVGKYNLLSSEQSWDGKNYNFQDMEGIRGVISFGINNMVCVIQNDSNYLNSVDEIKSKLFEGADEEIIDLVRNEALPYLLFGDDGKPAASTAFWSNKNCYYSNHTEKEILQICNNSLLPYLFNEDDSVKYWTDYYEMSVEQVNMMNKIFDLRIKNDSKIILENSMKEELQKWFKDIDECIESFSEIDIYFV